MKLLKTLAASAALVGLLAGSAAAQDFADVDLPRTIRVIVAYNAGGSSDGLARVTLPHWEAALEELTGQSTNAVVVNLPGAGGEIGWTALANAQPDGSTIGIINLPAVPMVEAARETQFSPWLEKFVPLGLNVVDPNVIRLSSKSKHKTLKDAIEAAKANPGSVTVGADGPLSDDHVAMYALQDATGAEFTFIPFAGGAPANRAFLAGEVDIAVGNVFDHLKTVDGATEAIVLRDTRYDMIPDVPTADEYLGMDTRSIGSSRGFAAPAGSPDDLVEAYRAAFEQAFNNEEFQAEAKGRNITIVEPAVGEDFGAVMQDLQKTSDDLMPLFVKGGYIQQ